MTAPLDVAEAARRIVERSTREQGLPVVCDDGDLLFRLACMVKGVTAAPRASVIRTATDEAEAVVA